MIVWLIGLAGAGKTVIGRELYSQWKQADEATVFLDGDHVREIMGHDLGHTIGERYANGWRICRLCQYLDRQDINVVCSILSLFPEHQAWNRQTYSRYFEVFIDVPLDILVARDQKGLYSGATTGAIKNVAGFDIPFTPPPHADLVLSNTGRLAEVPGLAKQIHEAALAAGRRAP